MHRSLCSSSRKLRQIGGVVPVHAKLSIVFYKVAIISRFLVLERKIGEDVVLQGRTLAQNFGLLLFLPAGVAQGRLRPVIVVLFEDCVQHQLQVRLHLRLNILVVLHLDDVIGVRNRLLP